MSSRPRLWELAAGGIAAGGAAVWAVAAAAWGGWLRAMLDLYPKSSWDRVTWVLIPVLLMLPLIVQGTVVARLSGRRPLPGIRGIAGSVVGTLLVLAMIIALFAAAHRLPAATAAGVMRALPVPLVLGCGALLVAGGVGAAGRVSDRRWVRRAAVPAGLAAAGVAWVFARGWVLSASHVLGHAEIVAYFVAVALGGGVGSAWSTRETARGELTETERGRYNVPS